jgi:hypothetical protein
MSSSSAEVKCPFCPKRCASEDGLNRHLGSKATCREALARQLQATLEHARIEAEGGEKNSGGGGEGDVAAETELDADEGHSSSLNALHYVPPLRSSSPEPDQHPAKCVRTRQSSSFGQRLPRYVEPYPGLAGESMGQGETRFERRRREVQEAGHNRWWPFKTKGEWELAEFMARRMNHTEVKEFLQLELVRVSFLFYHVNGIYSDFLFFHPSDTIT